MKWNRNFVNRFWTIWFSFPIIGKNFFFGFKVPKNQKRQQWAIPYIDATYWEIWIIEIYDKENLPMEDII